MIGSAPEFMNSKYYVPYDDENDVNNHMMPEASNDLKKAFEEYYNTPEHLSYYKEIYRDMENPYYSWEGKIIEKS